MPLYINDRQGVRFPEVGIDWAALMRFKRTDTDPAPAFFEQSFAQAGIEAFHGRARFISPTSVAVGDAVLHPGRMSSWPPAPSPPPCRSLAPNISPE